MFEKKERERDRQADRQKSKQAETEAGTNRQTSRQTVREGNTYTPTTHLVKAGKSVGGRLADGADDHVLAVSQFLQDPHRSLRYDRVQSGGRLVAEDQGRVVD